MLYLRFRTVGQIELHVLSKLHCFSTNGKSRLGLINKSSVRHNVKRANKLVAAMLVDHFSTEIWI